MLVKESENAMLENCCDFVVGGEERVLCNEQHVSRMGGKNMGCKLIAATYHQAYSSQPQAWEHTWEHTRQLAETAGSVPTAGLQPGATNLAD
jgi:hypothetical protein